MFKPLIPPPVETFFGENDVAHDRVLTEDESRRVPRGGSDRPYATS